MMGLKKEKSVMFQTKLKELRKKNNLTQEKLAAVLNVERTTIAKWEGGVAQPTAAKLVALSNILNTSLDLLLLGNEPNSPTIKIPLFSDVSTKQVKTYIDVPSDISNPGDYFAVEAFDDSMAPYILARDVLIIRSQTDVRDQDIAIVSNEKREMSVRRVSKLQEGVELVSSTGREFYTNEQVLAAAINIVGRLVELRRKL